MSEFAPVTTLRELAPLDGDEVLAGYRSGLRGDPEPGNTATRSFWHGWRNGATDAGHRGKDEAQAQLARDMVRLQRAH